MKTSYLPESVKKILVIQLRQIGDIILTTPSLRALKNKFPCSHLVFLSHSMGREIISGLDFVDEHLIYDHFFNNSLGQIKLLNYVRKYNFDLVIDYMNNPRSAIMTYASRAPKRIAFDSRRYLAYTHRVERAKNPIYIVNEKLSLLRPMGINSSDIKLRFVYTPSDIKFAKEFCKSLSNKYKCKVMISPTHRRAERKWSSNNFIKLANFLVSKLNAGVIWTWGPGEEDEVKCIQNKCNVKTYITPKTTLKNMGALSSLTDLFIGNSNGPSHIAVACGRKSLQIHGPTSGISWCPNTIEHQYISAKNRDVNEISPEQVISRVMSMITL